MKHDAAFPHRPHIKVIRLGALGDLFARVHARRGARSLADIQQTFGLSKAETGRIFGVTRQAVDDWYARGVPSARLADVERAAHLARALRARFKPERLPQIVRASMPGLQGQSILAAVTDHGIVRVFEMLDRAFSYIPAA